MQRDQVISILESLTEGQPEFVVEALTIAVGALRKEPRPAAAGQPWTEEEDAQLCAELDAGMPIREIAEKHGRSRNAITLRLVKWGRVGARVA
ncbi:MAG TPA: hypothetical protein VGD79_10415 [Thermoanaerobaculia bacterium]|jgi:hypothetical protein